jgi:5-methylcytosine-specific restriction endonuclease McrA
MSPSESEDSMAARIAPQDHTPVAPTKRLAMSAARKVRIWGLCGGVCGVCGIPVPMSGPLVIYDHWSPLAQGTPDDDEHVQVLCFTCNAAKFTTDMAAIGKSRRLAKREAGETKPKRKIPQRVNPWPKRRMK